MPALKYSHPKQINRHGSAKGYNLGCRCDLCVKAQRRYHQRWRNREGKESARAEEHLKRSYGLTQKDVEQMIADQGGRCLICARVLEPRLPVGSKKTHVDHCHVTGKVRGMLCDRCNKGLGYFDDNPEALRAAARYLERAT